MPGRGFHQEGRGYFRDTAGSCALAAESNIDEKALSIVEDRRRGLLTCKRPYVFVGGVYLKMS